MIPAIETQYKGYRFRSRTEARFAVFFDVLKIQWEYEPQGFVLPSGNYLPDFLLLGGEGQKIWAEVKPKDQTCPHLEHLTAVTRVTSVLLNGGPRDDREDDWRVCFDYDQVPVFEDHLDEKGFPIVIPGSWQHIAFPNPRPLIDICNWLRNESVQKVYDRAVYAFRGARFEFGETPVDTREADGDIEANA